MNSIARYVVFGCFFAILFIGFSHLATGRYKNPIIKPTVISFKDLPRIPQGFIYPGRERIEGEPPYQPPGRIPDITELTQVTMDKTLPPKYPAINAVVGTGYQGISQGGYIPSEPSPAAGPLNMFTTGNISVTVSNKDGSNRAETFGKIFWGAPSSDDSISDPVCMYDAQRGRFIALSFTTDGSTYSHYFLAISQTNDANGNWYRYMFDWMKDNNTTTTNWGDFEEFGFSTDKFVISSQQFNKSGTYQYQKLRVLNRDSLYQGLAVSYVDLVNFSNQVFVTKPGRNLSSDSTVYLLATAYNGGSKVTVGRITGPSNNPSVSFGTSVTVQTYGATVNARGGSSTASVITNDCRTTNFVVRNGYLHAAWHFGVRISGTNVDAIRYLKLNVASWPPSVVTDETFSAASTYMYYPFVTVDSIGTMFLGFGRSSTAEYPSSYVTGKRRIDTSIEPSTLAKAGTAVTTQSRWGDYTGGDMDETIASDTGSKAWYAGQWTAGANIFGTWISPITFTYCKINGQVVFDSDGDTTTTGDQSSLSGWTVSLKQGSTVVASTTTDGSGNYSFRYIDPLKYNVVLTLQSGYGALPVHVGTGGTSQSMVNNYTVADSVTGTQVSAGNTFIVTNIWRSSASGNWNTTSTWLPGSTPPSDKDVVVSNGTTVTFNSNDTCQNLTINGAAQFDVTGGRTLDVKGTLSLNTSSNFNLANNTLILEGNPVSGTPSMLLSTGNSSIIINGSASGYSLPSSISTLKNLTLNNVSDLSLANSLSIQGILSLNSGIVSTNGDTVVIGSTGSVSRGSGWIIGTEARHFGAIGSKIFDIGTTNGYSPITVNATGGTFPTVVPYIATAVQSIGPGVPGTNVLQRYWTLSSGSISEASLTFSYRDSDVVGTEAAYSLSRKDPVTGIWEIEGGIIDNIAHTATISGAPPSSQWTLGEPSALPIRFASFTGRMIEHNLVRLDWSTVTELNNLGYYVQRRKRTENNYSAISSLITGTGSSLTEHSYSWTDSTISGGTFVYRLREVDLDGSNSYSGEIVVEQVTGVQTEDAPRVFQLLQNYPNPFNPVTTIQFSLDKSEHVTLKIFNMLGQEVATLFNGLGEAGRYYHASFDASRIGSGIYIYRITTPSHTGMKKMLIIK